MKRKTHENVVNLRRKNPCLTLQEIGEKCGITRERVRQHLKEAELPTVGLGKKYCHYCGKHLNVGEKYKSLAPNKTVSFHHYCCFSCWDIIRPGKTIMLECEVCGILFPRKESLVIIRLGRREYQHVFCSKKCQGKWFFSFWFF